MLWWGSARLDGIGGVDFNVLGNLACINEMGAAWMMQNTYHILTLPGFDFSDKKFQGRVAFMPRSSIQTIWMPIICC